jgi:signal transduction histidine kinase
VAADAVLAIAAATASLAMANDSGAVFFAWVTTAPLALRRIRPITVFWIVLAGIVLARQHANVVTFIAIVLAAYSAVVHSRFRGAAVFSVLLAALMVTAALPDTTPPLPGRFTALLVLIPVVLVGNSMHSWRSQADDSRARLQSIQAEHEAATVRAVVTERARIAAELHDVVTHSVSVMVVQAGAARRVMAASPGEATAALLAVEATGRAAMIELQHLLGLLSPADGMDLRDAGLLQPQPGLDQLRPLIDRVYAAGLPARLIVIGEPGALQPGVGLAAYRVVQEAITNVLKHAGQAPTTVRLDYRPDELFIDVSDDGPRVTGRQSSLAAAAGGGRGLIGLRERVLMYGGEFDAGPRPAGGWRVTARLPAPPQPDGAGQAEAATLAQEPART